MVIVLFLVMVPVAVILVAMGWHAWAEPPGSPLFALGYWLLATLALVLPGVAIIAGRKKEEER